MRDQAIEDRGEVDAALRERFGWLPYRLLGGAALAGCAAVIACDLTMWFLVSGYDPVAQTISELGAGPHHEVQDTGLVLFCLGVLALAFGMILRGRSGRLALMVRAGFVLLAADVAGIALWNEYGDGEPGGLVIHPWLVGLLYVLVGFLLWFGPDVQPARGTRISKVAKGAAIVWLLAAPVFYLVPDGIDGLYERGLAGLMLASVAVAAYQLFRQPQPDAD